jgi:hypothetical protein
MSSQALKTKLSVLKLVDVNKPKTSALLLDQSTPVHITLRVEAQDEKAASFAFEKLSAFVDELARGPQG